MNKTKDLTPRDIKFFWWDDHPHMKFMLDGREVLIFCDEIKPTLLEEDIVPLGVNFFDLPPYVIDRGLYEDGTPQGTIELSGYVKNRRLADLYRFFLHGDWEDPSQYPEPIKMLGDIDP